VEQAKQEHALQEDKNELFEIDPEFSNLLFPLSSEEYQGLERSIGEHGFDNSLGKFQVWIDPETGKRLLIEGHTRNKICKAKGVKITEDDIEIKSFANRDEVKLWIVKNQLDRRNLTAEQRAFLIHKYYEAEKKTSGAPGGNENASIHGGDRVTKALENKGVIFTPLIPAEKKGTEDKPEAKEKTSEKIAKKMKVSEKTIHDSNNFGKAVEKIAENTGIQPQEILSRDVQISQKDVKDIAKMPPEKQKEAITQIKKSKTPKETKKAVQEKKAEIEEEKRQKRIEEAKEKTKASPPSMVHQIIPGDFLDAAIEEESIDLVVTSPGYNLGKDYGVDVDDAMPYEKWLDFLYQAFVKLHVLVKTDGGRLCVNVPLDTFKGDVHRPVYADVLKTALDAGFTYNFTIIWNEGNISSGTAYGTFAKADSPYCIAPVETIIVLYRENWEKPEGGVSTITAVDFKAWANGLWAFPGEKASKIGHPAPFPVELAHRCIQLFSCFGDTVLDPFLGSGTTLVACANDDRKGIGIEINPVYCDLARVRVAEAEATAAEKKKE
jgi:site-specific DNA-methyltransferase (adenine-specific)